MSLTSNHADIKYLLVLLGEAIFMEEQIKTHSCLRNDSDREDNNNAKKRLELLFKMEGNLKSVELFLYITVASIKIS